MTIKIGINGYGRIGRNMLRALYESGKNSEIEILAVNDLGDANTNAHLTRRDTAHGRFPGPELIQGLRYAASVLFQAAECLEGTRDYVQDDVELELKSP